MRSWPRTPPPSGLRLRDPGPRGLVRPTKGGESPGSERPAPRSEVSAKPWWVDDFIAIELFLRKGAAVSR
jgi:hypothetical protein